MKSLLALAILLGCATQKPAPETIPATDYFAGASGCFLLYNIKTQQFEKKTGDHCETRYPACSSFKVPLAVMAFDSGVLKDEKQTLKWDGTKRMIDAWNKDHNAETWMRESVVWFSQELTPKMGKNKLQKYLKDFSYGNQDLSTGMTQAWLNSPSDKKGSLAINAYEQVEFMKNLWSNKLPVSERAMELTRQITYLETSPNGWRLSGKTGSNFYDAERRVRLGWFISHIQKGDASYIAVTTFSDLAPQSTDKFGGFVAKELTKKILADNQLW
jgi:beta-lactamase class D